MLDTSARFCPRCASAGPFGYNCPKCFKDIKKEYMLCPNCGRGLYIACPRCGQRTFVQEVCECCRMSLMVPCNSKRCGVMQFFQNETCTACGKKIKSELTKK